MGWTPRVVDEEVPERVIRDLLVIGEVRSELKAEEHRRQEREQGAGSGRYRG